jgi:hypothetical protein
MLLKDKVLIPQRQETIQAERYALAVYNRYSILTETDNDGEDTLTSKKRFESGITPVAEDNVIVTKTRERKTVKTRITGHQKLSLLGIPSLNILTQKSVQRGK